MDEFDFDLSRHTGHASQLLPDLIETLTAEGLDAQPKQQQVLLRPSGSRQTVTLAFEPKGSGLLQAQVPVTSLPAPLDDGVYATLARWNAAHTGLVAHTQADDDQLRIVIRATLTPHLESQPAFTAADVQRATDDLVAARAGLLGELTRG